jgi:preprotein translocase subunit SecE
MTKKKIASKSVKKSSPLDILRSIKVELQKVKWPTHQQTIKLTLTVVFVSLAVGLYISGLDVLFTKVIQSIIN